jgi:hypothetical protein
MNYNYNNNKVESSSIKKKDINIKECSNITRKTKSRINLSKKPISKNKKNSIVKSNSMKIFQNNNNDMINYILSLNKTKNIKKTNQKNKIQINKDKFNNYKNKSDILARKNKSNSPKIKNIKNTRKTNLFMNIINNNNYKNIKINKISNNKNGKNKTYGNRIVKCNSSSGLFNTEKFSTLKNKKNLKKNRTHISMQNISNSNDFNYNLSDNYKTINAQYNYSRTKTKKSIRLINNKSLKTFFNNNLGSNNKKRKVNKNIKSHKNSSIDII